jgi:hypothetical protein
MLLNAVLGVVHFLTNFTVETIWFVNFEMTLVNILLPEGVSTCVAVIRAIIGVSSNMIRINRFALEAHSAQ